MKPIRRGSKFDLLRSVTPGQKCGCITLLHRATNDKAGRIRFHCKCDCGKTCDVRLGDLANGHTKSCGCLRATNIARRLGPVFLKRMGNLTPLGALDETSIIHRLTKWTAICHFCKTALTTTTSQIRARNKRCPCLNETYVSWRNMVQRCTNQKHEQYSDYGGRGINIYDPWRKSFSQFAKDMGRRPKGMTLDRKTPNGNYSPENCQWSDAGTQARNRRIPEPRKPPLKKAVKGPRGTAYKV